MPPWWITAALTLLTFLGEARTWRDYRRRSAPSAQDAGSFRLNNILAWAGLVLGLSAWALLGPRRALAVPAWVAWAGVPLALAGTGLRAWAVSTLGRWFTLTIQVRPGQPVVDRGPYHLLRHPSYAGGDLAILGVGLTTGNWLTPALLLIPWLVAHRYRIRVEERALLDTLGEPYCAYQARTWRMVPWVW
jgi:protein-S-isoprenylcysteine O-methyltransferase Ste14